MNEREGLEAKLAAAFILAATLTGFALAWTLIALGLALVSRWTS